MSTEYVVWAEMTAANAATNTSSSSKLLAYNRATHALTTLTQSSLPLLQYAVTDHRVVWSDTQLHIADLSNNQTSVLYTRAGMAPAISGDTVVWSAGSGADANGLDIWGLKLNPGSISPLSSSPVLLVSAPGNQLGATIAGDVLAWQSDGGPTDGQISTTSLSAAFASPPPMQATDTPLPYPPPDQPTPLPWTPLPLPQPTAQPPVAPLPSPTPTPTTPVQALTFSRPMVKGMHAPNSTAGWGSDSAAINALVNTSQSAPYFGAVTVLENDLGLQTHASGQWGPTVCNAMRALASSSPPVEVIVRSMPPSGDGQIYFPTPDGEFSPDDDVNRVISDLAWRNWMRRVQIENEPDGEWPSICRTIQAGCSWRGGSLHFVWSNVNDYRFYQAINLWYKAVRDRLQVYITTCNPSDAACTNFRKSDGITLWTPPMNPGFSYANLSNGANRNVYLRPMINDYKCPYNLTTTTCFSYHAYPVPNDPGPFGGGIRNDTYDHFYWSLQQQIDGTFEGLHTRSEITEWGWDPGEMIYCRYTQDQNPWPANGTCPTTDGNNHYFEDDIAYFRDYYRHGADTMTVWLTRGWHDPADPDPNAHRADGVHSDGSLTTWFMRYQQR